MKKVVALLLALVMVFALVACGGGTPADSGKDATPADSGGNDGGNSGKDTPAPDSGDSGDSGAPEHDLTAAGGFGFWQNVADYDFSKEERHKIGLISYSWDQMLQTIADNFSVWAEKMNCDFMYCDSDSNAETLINNIELYASQGCEGLIINSFSTYVDTVIDLCDELGIPWWSMSEPMVQQSTGKLMAPYAQCNDYQWGYDVATKVAEYVKEAWGDFDTSKTRVLAVSLTTLTVFVERSDGFEAAITEKLPGCQFELCDGLSEGGISAEVGYSIASTRATANPDVEHWIYLDVMGYFAPGINTFIDEQKWVDKAVIGSVGGDVHISMLEKGTEGAWKVNLYSDYSICISAPWFGTYALVAGWGTKEDIWADVKPEGATYSHIDCAYVNMTSENYKDYFAFVDQYQGLNHHPDYEWSGKVYAVMYGDGGATE
ncbi:MAG: substrate-binding domain-containing protein [Oscillospiraceae bacterium]|nr:substrate-binding domain-containing protein [Oscillospiraceae bacterium]